jgi:hypothetical protein
LCKHIVEDIKLGRCEGCKQIVYNLNNMTEDIKTKMKHYSVKAVPTTVIDGNIKVEGYLTFIGYAEEIYFKSTNEIIHLTGTKIADM